MAIEAIRRNRGEDPDYIREHICIELYEAAWLEKWLERWLQPEHSYTRLAQLTHRCD